MRRERINVGFISSISLFHIKLIKQRRFWYYLIEELPYLIILQNNVHKYLPMLSKSPFQMTLHAKRSIMHGQNRHAFIYRHRDLYHLWPGELRVFNKCSCPLQRISMENCVLKCSCPLDLQSKFSNTSADFEHGKLKTQ